MNKVNGSFYTVGANEADSQDAPVNGGGAVPFMEQEIIPGLKNQYLVIGVGAALLLGVMRKR